MRKNIQLSRMDNEWKDKKNKFCEQLKNKIKGQGEMKTFIKLDDASKNQDKKDH